MVKNTLANAGDLGSIPGWGRSPGVGKGYPLQYSGLENPMDRGAWRAAVRGVAQSQARLSEFHHPVSVPCGVFPRAHVCPRRVSRTGTC